LAEGTAWSLPRIGAVASVVGALETGEICQTGVAAAAGADPLASDAASGSAVCAGRLNDSKCRNAEAGAGAGPGAGTGTDTGAGAGVATRAGADAVFAADIIEAEVMEAGHANAPPVAGPVPGAAGPAAGAGPASAGAAGAGAGAGPTASDAAGAAAAAGIEAAAAGNDRPHAWQLVCPRKTSRAPQNWHVWPPAPCPNINSTSHPPGRDSAAVPASMTLLVGRRIA
jgi:hypothetical protein